MLADQIYRNRANLQYCKQNGIRISGKPLGRPKRDPDINKKQERQEQIDRIEVERKFSCAKGSFGLGLIYTSKAEGDKPDGDCAVNPGDEHRPAGARSLYLFCRTPDFCLREAVGSKFSVYSVATTWTQTQL